MYCHVGWYIGVLVSNKHGLAKASADDGRINVAMCLKLLSLLTKNDNS